MKIWKKAFTLIELMIVVVILWILMSTILPKLTWAQARARDAWRVADISNIAAALQVYYDDNGKYPWGWSWWCLSSTAWIASDLKGYMQSQKVPLDPQPTSNSYSCAKNTDDAKNKWLWKYFYYPLVKDWLNDNAYVLCADVETYQKSNTDDSKLIKTKAKDDDNWVIADDHDYSDFIKVVWNIWDNAARKTVNDDDAWRTVYCILRP